jgi:hypothetical protein
MPCVKFGLDEKYIYNICLIVASHALWCTHVLPFYYTKSHLELQRLSPSGIMWNVYHYHLELFICGTIPRSSFATSLVMPCVRFGLNEKNS